MSNITKLAKTYKSALDTMARYDVNGLELIASTHKSSYHLDYESAKILITEVRSALSYSDIFGQEKDHSLPGIIGNLYQTFEGQELYSSLEEKAANLLYLIIKDHPFVDGNKRIGSILFLYFLELNDIKHNFNTSGIVSLAIMIAMSPREQKEHMVKLITNLI